MEQSPFCRLSCLSQTGAKSIAVCAYREQSILRQPRSVRARHQTAKFQSGHPERESISGRVKSLLACVGLKATGEAAPKQKAPISWVLWGQCRAQQTHSVCAHCLQHTWRQVAFSVSKQMYLLKVQDLGSQATFPAPALLVKIL